MISKTYTIANLGLEGFLVTIEADSNKALPTIEIVGLADTSVKEAKERVRAAFRNLDINLPNRKFIINLSPSNIKKSGNRYDLPIAIGILQLVLDSLNKTLIDNSIFIGELGLDGQVKPVEGIIPIVLTSKRLGFKYIFVPNDNAQEASFIKGINIISIKNLKELIEYLTNAKKLNFLEPKEIKFKNDYEVDFSYIKGNFFQKRALMIAAAGAHNILMIGSPGSGKTMLAKALKGILPPMNEEEILETSMIYSIKGLLSKHQPIINFRPYRVVHHTASSISIIGGGSQLLPGEISLANNGVLFFDELAEFSRQVLEVLRQPLEDRKITISRVVGSVSYPSKFMFVAAMNPCKCGFYKDKEKQCTCSLNEVRKYQSRISGPLLDRFDVILEVPRQNLDKILSNKEEESSEEIRKKVIKAWEIQKERFKNEKINFNSQMDTKLIDKYCLLSNEVKEILKKAGEKLSLSARALHRVIKLSRTLADLEGKDNIEKNHILEALQYRSKSMFIEE